MSTFETIVLIVPAVVIILIVAAVGWKVPASNEALIITGMGAKTHVSYPEAAGFDFAIVTGRGKFTIPWFQKVERLGLDLHETELSVECVSHEALRLRVGAVVIYKVGDDHGSIANASRRFIDREDEIPATVVPVFTGHLRAIAGNVTLVEMQQDREKLTELVRASSGTEMEKLGLIVDSLQIQEIERLDPETRPITGVDRVQLRTALADWTDVDTAQFKLGVALGLFDPDTWFEHKGTFWSSNPVGGALASCLDALATSGVLEKRDEPDLQFRAAPAS